MDSEVPKHCFGCKKPIEDEYRLRVSPDLEWHAACLACFECQKLLDENCTCFMHEGRPYCRRDYVRLFGVKCAHCSEHISAADMVMRARAQVFHLDCFRCGTCERKLLPGEQFGLSNGKVFCKLDFDALPPEALGSPTDPSNANEKSRSHSAVLTNGTDSASSRAKRSNSDKGPRVRTVLSEQQLQTLRTVYSSNPRPDALLKEHLVEITGLSPRVIRVWFQNKRCKDKKKAIQAEAVRLQSLQQQQGSAKSVMPPLTPQTPLTPDSMGQISPHPGMSAFTYPAVPTSYDQLAHAVPSSQQAVSPVVTYQHNPSWGSPSGSPFEGAEFSSPITTEQQQTFIYSSANTTPNHFAF